MLVGGFLGSGKTTAILQATRLLMKSNRVVGVVTNDQGALQVDAEFMRGNGIPTAEVSDGCFCCRYGELEDGIGSLVQSVKPEIVFAEPVGSCVDLAATVVNPLLSLNPDRSEIVLSVFADCRHLLMLLEGDTAGFYDNVAYIYEHQLQEADILVVNKIDLISEQRLEWAKQRIGRVYGDKPVLFQNSLSEESVGRWLTACNELCDRSLRPALEIDYDIYGAGEAQLAWLDAEFGIVAPDGNAITMAYALMRGLNEAITEKGYPVGHLKFLLDDGKEKRKISYTSITGSTPVEPQAGQADRAVVTVNARIQVVPSILQSMVSRIIIEVESRTGARITESHRSAFQPGYPRPTHRINRQPSP